MSRKYMSGGAMSAPIPPALVTVGDMENSNVLTVAWTGILATKPPRTYVSVRPSRHSYSYLKERGEFVINLPSGAMVREVDFAGIYTGKKIDKFKRCGFTKVQSDKVSPPTIAECPIALECRVCDVISMGTHVVFIADIVATSCDEGLLDGEGKIHFERADLIAYAHGEYYSLGEQIGKFGFSTDKAEKKSEKARDISSAKINSKRDTVQSNRALDNGGRSKADEVSENDRSAASKNDNRKTVGTHFYDGVGGQRKKRVYKDKEKGRPHGKRVKEKQK